MNRKGATRVVRPFGLTLPLLEAGPRESPEAVLFLHGHPGSSLDWRPLLEQTGEFARALAFDLPGLGRADKPQDWDYGYGAYGGVVAAVVNSLGLERVHLVMHDAGGGAGLAWAAAHPQQFASAVICATGVLIGYDWHWLAALQRSPLGPIITRGTTRPAFKAALWLAQRGSAPLPREFVERLWADYDLASRRAMMRMYRASPPSGFERLAPVFRDLDRPALVLWGANDPFVPVTQAYRQRESFPSARVHVVEGSGHWPWIDQPARAVPPILDFLRDVTTSPRPLAPDSN